MKTNTKTKTLFRSLPLILLFMVLRVNVKAQGPTPVPPDCVVFINSWTTAQSSASFNNTFTGCVSWTLQYASVGFSGLTLTVQSANAATATTPSTFGTFAGTVAAGVNPNTSTTGAITALSNGTVSIPWIRVRLSGLTGTGTVIGILYGYKTGYTGGAGKASVTVPGGIVGSVQYKDSSTAFGGNSLFVYDTTGVQNPIFNSSGLDDLTSGGSFTDGRTNPGSDFFVRIDHAGTPDTFQWQKNGGSFTSGVAITGAAQTLSDGVVVTFGATTGHTLNDNWDVLTTINLTLDGVSSSCASQYNVAISFAAGGPFINSFDPSCSLGNAFLGFGSGGSGTMTSSSGENTGVGSFTLDSITSGSTNTAIGKNSGQHITSGGGNSLLGQRSGTSLTTGSSNTVLGRAALLNSTTASQNVALGFLAGALNISGSGNIFIGYQSGENETGSNKLYVDNSNTATPCIGGDLSGRVLTPDCILQNKSVVFASLQSSPADGMQEYCSDCTVTSGIDNTCANSGSGAVAFRVNGAWKCTQ